MCSISFSNSCRSSIVDKTTLARTQVPSSAQSIMRPSFAPSSNSDELSLYLPVPFDISFDCYSDMCGYSSSYPDSELSFPHTPLDYTAVTSIPSFFEMFDWGLVHSFPDGRTRTTTTACTSQPSFITPEIFSPISSNVLTSPVHDIHVQWPSGSPCSSSSSYEEDKPRHQGLETTDSPREGSPPRSVKLTKADHWYGEHHLLTRCWT